MSDTVSAIVVNRDGQGHIVAGVFVSAKNRQQLEDEKLLSAEQLQARMAYLVDREVDQCPNAEVFRDVAGRARSKRLGVWVKG